MSPRLQFIRLGKRSLHPNKRISSNPFSFWWDSSGPTFFHQVSGLLGYGIPASQILYGTDFPYAPFPVQVPSLAAVKNSPLFTASENTGIFRGYAKTLFTNKIQCTFVLGSVFAFV